MDITKEQLEDLYIKQGLTTRQCAEALELPSHGGISWRLRKFNIQSRPGKFQKGQRQHFHKIGKDASAYKGGKQAVLCDACGKELLKFPSLIKETNFCNIQCRSQWRSENFKGKANPNHGNLAMVGPANPNWKGGITCDDYCDAWKDREFKEDIKARDNYECQNPDCRKNSDKLHIHHINYNKQDCHPCNLITLCVSCNARANFNRDFWEAGYKEIIRLKYETVNQQISQLNN